MSANRTAEAKKPNPQGHFTSSEAAATWPPSRIFWVSWAIGTTLAYGDFYLPEPWHVSAAICGLAIFVVGLLWSTARIISAEKSAAFAEQPAPALQVAPPAPLQALCGSEPQFLWAAGRAPQGFGDASSLQTPAASTNRGFGQ